VLHLDRLADVEELLGAERGDNPGHRVEEVRLVEDLTDRFGLIQGGDGLDGDVVRRQVGEGAGQM
jgi:hypothetical protein